MNKLICLALVLAVAAAALAAGTGDIKCATCGRVIKKTRHYLEYNGKSYCSQTCLEAALPRCATCGKIVGDGNKQGEFLKHKGKIYCSRACFEEALPTCAICGKPVNGGILADNKYYCDTLCHEKALPRCEICGKPVNGGLRSQLDPDKAYCSQECFNATLPACDLCGARMQAWSALGDKKYCESCAKLPRCSDCQRPGAGFKLSDGRLLCKDCSSIAIFDTARAREMYEQVRLEIKEKLGLSTDHAIAFHLVDLDRLKRAARIRHSSERGFYRYYGQLRDSAGVRRMLKQTYDIYLLNGLRTEEFKDVAAHELAHDIQQRLYPRIKDKVLKEGFAEYVASLMATAWGAERLNQERLRNEFKDYVAGYKQMAKIGADGGLAAVLDYLKKQNRAR